MKFVYNEINQKEKRELQMTSIIIDGQTHYLISMTASKMMERKENASRTCALSRRLIQTGDEITLISNNFVCFPNKMVLTEEMNSIGVEKSIRHIKERYENYLRLKEEFSEWEGC